MVNGFDAIHHTLAALSRNALEDTGYDVRTAQQTVLIGARHACVIDTMQANQLSQMFNVGLEWEDE